MSHIQSAPGATLSDGGVLFRLWAPKAEKATLRLNPDGVAKDLFMSPAPAGYWEVFVEEAAPGDRYLFSVDSGF
ncbi:MAG: hypothetical protein KY432_10445, partial [Acidobacteria bacterium]|nr:hypothetical protein [Acidobacteriota bacterium]